MKTVNLDVFIEPDCKACISVMYSIREVQSQLSINVKVYRRDVDREVFRDRNVIITPAIFIDGKLIFYGEVSPEKIREKIQNLYHG